ncbi:hypothetical protein [Pseudonocardia nigra]|uniref:hypothetical protein n=1 Tax=Pseudonocardia nigra TaxID=1921578 RepID=UPI001C5DD637|nr:hypothetical protein [Pseudonocardia nigra]
MTSVPIRWRYLLLGLGFLALAGIRAVDGAAVWAAVFGLAAVANGWLAWHEGARAPERARVNPASGRQWQVLAVACLVVGGGLLLLEPSLAVIAAAAALFCLHRARQAARTLQPVSGHPVSAQE